MVADPIPARTLCRQILVGLDALKATDVLALDVFQQTSITDVMIVATGRSDRQVRALSDKVVEIARAQGVLPLGIEGQREGEWVLVDLGDVVVHLMQPDVRDYYQLEKLWQPAVAHSSSASETIAR